MSEGIAFTISAPSGAGKSTLAKKLLAEFPELKYSVSCTTRPMRPGEIDGKDYYFITKAEFSSMIEQGKFAEWAEVHGNLYGTPLAPVKETLGSGKNILFDIDSQGAAQIKMNLQSAFFVFILPPSLHELQKRLTERGSDTATTIKQRLQTAQTEIRESMWYDAAIINDDLQTCWQQLKCLYLSSQLKPGRHARLINSLLVESL